MGIAETAREFFEACETGKGWDGCAQYCHDDATFSCQSDALADVGTLEGYTDWMRDLLIPLPDGHYQLRAFSTDDERSVVTAVAVFEACETGRPTDGQVGRCGLRLCDGVRRWSDPAHDQDLERRPLAPPARLGLTPAHNPPADASCTWLIAHDATGWVDRSLIM